MHLESDDEKRPYFNPCSQRPDGSGLVADIHNLGAVRPCDDCNVRPAKPCQKRTDPARPAAPHSCCQANDWLRPDPARSVWWWARLDKQTRAAHGKEKAQREAGEKVKRIYIAGPMTGLPDFNYPAFNQEAERLRALGYHVENPADNPVPPCKSWSGYMRMAVAQLVTCDIVALLPNWHTSRGAAVEHRLALDLGLRVIDVHSVPAA